MLKNLRLNLFGRQKSMRKFVEKNPSKFMMISDFEVTGKENMRNSMN
jgi:hypothetical protein